MSNIDRPMTKAELNRFKAQLVEMEARFAEIPISAAKHIADKYGFDQVIVIGRKVGSHEHVTTYGVDKENCAAAAKAGNYLKHEVMKWPREMKNETISQEL